MNQNIVDFYQKVRVDQELIAELSAGETVDEIMDIAVTRAAKMGFFFTKEDALAAGADVATLRANVMNDDELNNFELELISAGIVMTCIDNSL